MKLNFRAFGSGPPLLVLHGLLGSLDNWVPQAQQLSSQFQVFLLDLRNHGRSPHAADFNYEVLTADLAEFLRDQNINRANVLGHSLGGKAAMRFAQFHPRSVDKLIVVDMAPREYAPRYDKILEVMYALDLSRLQQRAEVDAALIGVAPDKIIRQFLLKNIGRDETGRLSWKPNVASLRANYPNLRSALPGGGVFAGPTLFIRGGKSDHIRDKDYPLIRQMFPVAKFETIPTAGHWVHAEAPAEFLRIVSEFLLAEK